MLKKFLSFLLLSSITVSLVTAGEIAAKNSGELKERPVRLKGTSLMDLRKGVTMIAVGTGTLKGKRFGALFYKSKELIFSLRDRRLYFIVPGANGEWRYTQYGIHADKLSALAANDTSLHHFALTLRRYVEPDQGIDWTEAKIYLDGVPVGGKRYDHLYWKSDGADLLAGGVDESDPEFSPGLWQHNGNLDSIRVIDQALTEEEIQKDLLADSRLKPGFSVPAKLTALEKRMLQLPPGAHPQKVAICSALHNAALAGFPAWKRMAGGNFRGVYPMPGKRSSITLLADKTTAGLFSWYDHQAQRELLAWDNPFFELLFKIGSREHRISGNDPALNTRIHQLPQKTQQGWKFSLAGKHNASEKLPIDFTWQCDYTFENDRINYNLQVKKLSGRGRLSRSIFPAMRFKSFTGGGDKLLVPIMSGVEYPEASTSGASYCDTYPRGRASLQMGAYYDANGGILFATEDPKARVKNLSFLAGKESIRTDFDWEVPFTDENENTDYHSQCNAGLSLFGGDWYDVGLLYRDMLVRINAPWWRKDLPEELTAKWFRDNTIWIGRWLAWKNYKIWKRDLNHLRLWKEYIGSPGQAVHFYTWCGRFTRDWPHNPPSPDFVDRTKAMQEAGYRVVPYINGRIWEEKDRRDEDYRYTKVGLPATLKLPDGVSPHPEPFGIMFRVICPATKTFAEEMTRECNNMVIYGADGVYLDQIGAATHHLCYSREHGHPIADNDAWYMKGHRPVMMKIRADWKQDYPDGITTGEDISEATVGIMDGGLTWRWMYNGQVPLFAMIYSGRIQTFGQSWGESHRAGGDDTPAAPAKLTYQLFSGTQMGWFSIHYVVRPESKDMRLMLRQYAYLRVALLDFFNAGMMARPPHFREEQVPISRIWGRQGSMRVASVPLAAAAWKYRNVNVAMVANTAEKNFSNTMEFASPNGEMKIFYSNGKVESTRISGGKAVLKIDLAPREFAVAISPVDTPEGKIQMEKVEAAFRHIVESPAIPDPFINLVKSAGGKK